MNDGLPLQLDRASQVVIPASSIDTIGLSPESETGNPGELLICKVGSASSGGN